MKSLFKSFAKKKAPQPHPIAMHHPGASARPVDYLLPSSFCIYVGGFPQRVKSILAATRPDELNGDILDAEIQAVVLGAEHALLSQRQEHLDSSSLIRSRNQAFLLEVESQLHTVEAQMEDLRAALAALDENKEG